MRCSSSGWRALSSAVRSTTPTLHRADRLSRGAGRGHGSSVRSLDQLGAHDRLKIVVLRAGCSYRQRLESLLAARGVVGVRLLEFGTLEAILGCVAAGLGITLLPRIVVRLAARGGPRRPPCRRRRPRREVETVFIRRRDAFVSQRARSLPASTAPGRAGSRCRCGVAIAIRDRCDPTKAFLTICRGPNLAQR